MCNSCTILHVPCRNIFRLAIIAINIIACIAWLSYKKSNVFCRVLAGMTYWNTLSLLSQSSMHMDTRWNARSTLPHMFIQYTHDRTLLVVYMQVKFNPRKCSRVWTEWRRGLWASAVVPETVCYHDKGDATCSSGGCLDWCIALLCNEVCWRPQYVYMQSLLTVLIVSYSYTHL